jgi:hypothetical protein
MHRVINWLNAVPLETDLLNTNKYAQTGLGYLAQAALGTAICVDGLACTPTTPASLSVIVGTGSIYTQAAMDSTAFSSLGTDTAHQVIKQGILQECGSHCRTGRFMSPSRRATLS